MDTREATVSKWRTRFAEQGIEGLQDAPHTGAPARYNEQTTQRILSALEESPPEGFTRWDAPC